MGNDRAAPPPSAPSARQPVAFGDPRVFWAGVVACAAGVALHLPMYLSAAGMGCHMTGVETSGRGLDDISADASPVKALAPGAV